MSDFLKWAKKQQKSDTLGIMPSAIHVSSQTVYYETTHIQQKATDKTLSIAYCTQICTGKETIYEKDIKSLSCTAAFPDEILTCYITLYSVQCFIGFDCTELIFFLGGSSFVI